MYGGKVIPTNHGKMSRSSHVLSVAKRKMRRRRIMDEGTDEWEAAFQEFMAAVDDDHGVEPFLAAEVKLDSSPATARPTPKRRMDRPTHPYHGIRQRPWGTWSAEIRDPSKGGRLWIGTFDTPAEAARAYDVEARRIRGAKARTNFPADTASTRAPYNGHPRPAARCTDDGDDNNDHTTAGASYSSSKEVHGAASSSDTRILLECCSDDVMESLLACCDMACGFPVFDVANQTCTGYSEQFVF